MNTSTLAAARNIASAIAGILVTLGVLSMQDSTTILNALTAISGAVATIFTAVGTVTPIITAAWAAWRSTKTAQVATVQAMPDMQVRTTSQDIKDAVPAVTKVSTEAQLTAAPASANAAPKA